MIELNASDQIRELVARVAWIAKEYLSAEGAAILVAAFCVTWLIAAAVGDRVRGGLLGLWLLVPVFLVAAVVCIGGPGRLFAKEPYEGPTIVTFARKDGLTLLDTVGMMFVLFAYLSAILAVAMRWIRLRLFADVLLDASIILIASGIAAWSLIASYALIFLLAAIAVTLGIILLVRDLRGYPRIPAPRVAELRQAPGDDLGPHDIRP